MKRKQYIYPTHCPQCGSENIDCTEASTFDGHSLGYLINWCYDCLKELPDGYTWNSDLIEVEDNTDN